MHAAETTIIPGLAPRAAISRVNALILDDSLYDRKVIRRLCRGTSLPISLDEVDRITTLVPMLEQEDYNIIFLDYKLPEGNGFDAIKVIRNNARNRLCPIVMVTGLEPSGIESAAIDLGCDDCISKDGMTSDGLRDIVLKAIQHDAVELGHARDRSDNLLALCEMISSEYSTSLRPELARILGAMRALQVRLAETSTETAADLARIERQCVDLWAILMRPETSARPGHWARTRLH